MKNTLLSVLLISLSIVLNAQVLVSPDGNFKMKFSLTDNGEPTYQLSYKGKNVILPSRMGILVKDKTDFIKDFQIKEVKNSSFDEVWQPLWGETKNIRNQYNELCITLSQPKENNREMKIRFRLFNDGLGFRYEFERNNALSYFVIEDEKTEFILTGDHKVFWIPGDYDTNEYYYTTTKLSEVDASKVDATGIGTSGYFAKNGVQSPLMLKTDDGLYINIFEAALFDYPVMHLLIDKEKYKLTSILAPNAVGSKVFMQTPHHTPWRTIIVSDDATDILASNTILNLNEPCKIKDTSFIKPQKFIGIWWGMHVPNKMTWNYSNVGNIKLKDTDWNQLIPNNKHGANNENVKRYIDFAAANGFEGVLVEGWNVGWEDWAGNWKEEVFDFVTPYPDFDIEMLNNYAHSKGVKLIMHHETSSSVTNYERRLDDAISLMNKYGYDAVKTGYVGWIIPRGETHDGQWMVNHFQRVIEKMAENKKMIDQHESVRPTGQHRTYPNLMACEAARGNEFNAWSNGNPPEHETILPFTRLMGGPMDYTPGIFEIKMDYYEKGNTRQVHTTLAKQLALYVTMYSPLQMAADLPENYEKRMDAFQFIKDVAVDWDESKYLEAEPGDYITIARKEKNSENWFVGAITDENSRVATIDLNFLNKGQWYVAKIYSDTKNTHWKNNPMEYEIKTVLVNNKMVLKPYLANGGGVAISLMPAKKDDLKKYRKLRK